MKTKLYIIKIGGEIIDDEKLLTEFIHSFVKIDGPKILVHGGGKTATTVAKQLGIETTFINGRRKTSPENLKVVTMVYAGLINKSIVAQLQSNGCNSLGLCGADLNSIVSSKRPKKPFDFGEVGDIQTINSKMIDTLINEGVTPVFSAITHDKKGDLLNTNADTIASRLAVALSKNYALNLIYCFGEKGVLKSIDDKDSVISKLSEKVFEQLKRTHAIHSGMIPKLENGFSALQGGVDNVIISNIEILKNENGLRTQLIH